jgi:hypothetical protein
MLTSRLVMVALVGAVLASCAANDLKAAKDDSWSRMPQTLPDGRYIVNPALPTLSTLPDPYWAGTDSVPSPYAHPFRPLGILFYPFGVAFDYAVVRPLYMLGGLAPEWFGMTTDDAWSYHSHMPELTTSKDARRHLYE